MAKYYCMCQVHKSIVFVKESPLDNQLNGAPNRYGPVFENDEHRSVFLGESMELTVMGAQQRVCFAPNTTKPPRNKWKATGEERAADMAALERSGRHYPDVDVYRCKHCGAEIVVEG